MATKRETLNDMAARANDHEELKRLRRVNKWWRVQCYAFHAQKRQGFKLNKMKNTTPKSYFTNTTITSRPRKFILFLKDAEFVFECHNNDGKYVLNIDPNRSLFGYTFPETLSCKPTFMKKDMNKSTRNKNSRDNFGIGCRYRNHVDENHNHDTLETCYVDHKHEEKATEGVALWYGEEKTNQAHIFHCFLMNTVNSDIYLLSYQQDVVAGLMWKTVMHPIRDMGTIPTLTGVNLATGLGKTICAIRFTVHWRQWWCTKNEPTRVVFVVGNNMRQTWAHALRQHRMSVVDGAASVLDLNRVWWNTTGDDKVLLLTDSWVRTRRNCNFSPRDAKRILLVIDERTGLSGDTGENLCSIFSNKSKCHIVLLGADLMEAHPHKNVNPIVQFYSRWLPKRSFPQDFFYMLDLISLTTSFKRCLFGASLEHPTIKDPKFQLHWVTENIRDGMGDAMTAPYISTDGSIPENFMQREGGVLYFGERKKSLDLVFSRLSEQQSDLLIVKQYGVTDSVCTSSELLMCRHPQHHDRFYFNHATERFPTMFSYVSGKYKDSDGEMHTCKVVTGTDMFQRIEPPPQSNCIKLKLDPGFQMDSLGSLRDNVNKLDAEVVRKTVVLATWHAYNTTGLNLQNFTHVCLLDCGQTWGNMVQAISRLWRIGQRNEVQVHLLMDVFNARRLLYILKRWVDCKWVQNDILYFHKYIPCVRMLKHEKRTEFMEQHVHLDSDMTFVKLLLQFTGDPVILRMRQTRLSGRYLLLIEDGNRHTISCSDESPPGALSCRVIQDDEMTSNSAAWAGETKQVALFRKRLGVTVDKPVAKRRRRQSYLS